MTIAWNPPQKPMRRSDAGTLRDDASPTQAYNRFLGWWRHEHQQNKSPKKDGLVPPDEIRYRYLLPIRIRLFHQMTGIVREINLQLRCFSINVFSRSRHLLSTRPVDRRRPYTFGQQ